VVVPEQPAQQFELLLFGLAAEPAELLCQLEQDRRGLCQAFAVDLEHRNFAHLVDVAPPFRRSRHAAAEIGPYRLEALAAQREHQRELVAVSRLREVMQAVAGHGVLPHATAPDARNLPIAASS
jgi:hypothetical protein